MKKTKQKNQQTALNKHTEDVTKIDIPLVLPASLCRAALAVMMNTKTKRRVRT